ncbi:MAG: DegT/DnrJ/EryC1/StrS family aminotransferase, partial [Nitrospinaceae bacterium]
MDKNRSIPFFNYPALFASQKQEMMAVLEDVLGRGAYILQKDLESLEANLARFINVRQVYGVADGTNALLLALRAAGVGPGDEVILPSHTYVATAAAVHYAGAAPVLVECGADHLIDPEAAENAVTSRTKALMPVQLNGRTCDMDAIQTIADRHGLIIIEDAAQALGSKFKGQCAGTFGLAGTFSFYPAKVLGCFGDGGGVATNDEAMGRRLSLLRDHGRDENGEVVTWGTNCRLDNLQAAVLNFKLKTYERDIARRREIAARYDKAFKEIDDLTLPPPSSDGHHFDVFQNYEMEAGRREELRPFLEKNG